MIDEKERTSDAFIDDSLISRLLADAKVKAQDPGIVKQILTKALGYQGLSAADAATLLEVNDSDLLEELFAAASTIKEAIYGKRIVLFAPLYIANYCVNNCTYCGYRQANHQHRRRLTMDEIRREVEILESMGHKRLAVEAGEDPLNCSIDYVVEALQAIYSVKSGNGAIRRANVNIAATTIDEYKKLKSAGIGTYILFQETYNRPMYAKLHASGPKTDYNWHTTAMDRAMQAGIDDVGIGVLFGLYDYKYEVTAMLLHAAHLEATYGVGPHTISVPRLRPAPGITLSTFPYLVDNAAFQKIIAVIRLAVPYTGIILSTREDSAFRDILINYGVSQISAGSCTGVGGYQEAYHTDTVPASAAQFEPADNRSPEEIIRMLCEHDFIPSYCTACYRQGRTGDRFMRLAKSGEIQNVCLPNALLTFQEYLLDYATDEQTKASGEKMIQNALATIPQESIRRQTVKRLKEITEGSRDLYF
ncbi:[FeFe] hydrogenase H-cluster radical SAM maturase HydG [Propionispora vibrioides]|uniref:2-iminoacetate synthase n=1 Tax=Propionispora vibrioides TaxID=112903 RepID=A0A1H8XUV5_9FIRM|nr:[FeFe] hydrogenase H-cluster radical SAM maturase HydG [Propionispora vibrioides]SEP43541.1 2-iminoacetate synthase [Propionispora vibrioides]